MTTIQCPDEQLALYSRTGEAWLDWDTSEQSRPLTWEASELVTKIVIGTPPTGEENEIEVSVPDNLATLYPNLTHLHLWQISNLQQLPELPGGLACLDVRGCVNFSAGGIPEEFPKLETLLLDGSSLSAPQCVAFPALRHLSIKQCTNIAESWLHAVLRENAELQAFDASGCRQLASIPVLPAELRDLRLNDCKRLRSILDETNPWPAKLRRLELRSAEKLTSIRDFDDALELDYIDLAYTPELRSLPAMPKYDPSTSATRRPRTLFLFESGVPVDRDLYGESDDTNVAQRVLSDLEASAGGQRLPDHELKVILLGNGRCGKSSFARKWVHGKFREDEPSTHGIRLWEKQISFTPIDASERNDADLNIWDFAGQDLYHSTHRLFLQSRAIFLIFHSDHPLGADEQSDHREQMEIERLGEDVHRPPKYWIDQVQSLGKIPGLDKPPPVLVIRSKSDRNQGSAPVALEVPYQQVSFSAKTGEGLMEIEDWIEEQVTDLLGRFDARSLPTGPKQVKAELMAKMRENREGYWEMDETGKPFQSPNPTIDRDEFDQIVRRHCTGMYAEQPQLLLERFHRSGFFYYSEAYLPDHVILDQRWAIHGIYAFSSRQSEFEVRDLLQTRNGQFDAKLLAEHSWDPAGYSPEAQRLFLNFMLSCGMCFELLRDHESQSGQTVYAAPGFFPSRKTAAKRYPELETPSPTSWSRRQLAGATEVDVRSLIASLGSDWSRSMQAWRWGCRVVSATTGAVCWIDWPRPEDSEEYVFPLNVWFSGLHDRPFEYHIRERVQRYLEHPRYREDNQFSDEWEEIPSDELAKRGFLGGSPEAVEDTGRLDVRYSRPDAVGIRVTFSFAGSDDQQEENKRIGDIPSLLGRKLKEHLEREDRGEVLCYDLFEGEERLSTFVEDLARGDLTLVFWSKKYWQSEYCMTEMALIYQQPPEARLLEKRVLVFVFDGQRLSRDGVVKHNEWEDEWERRAIERDKRAEDQAGGDLRKKTKLLDRDGVLCNWYDLVVREGKFDDFVHALLDYRLGRPISIPRDDTEIEQVTNELLSLVDDCLHDEAALIDLAQRRLQQGRQEDAVVLLLHALALSSDRPDDVQAALVSPEIPDDLRQLAIDQLRVFD